MFMARMEMETLTLDMMISQFFWYLNLHAVKITKTKVQNSIKKHNPHAIWGIVEQLTRIRLYITILSLIRGPSNLILKIF